MILWVDMHVEFFSCLNSRLSLQSSVKASSLIRFRKRKFYISGVGHVVGSGTQYASEDSNWDGTHLLAKKNYKFPVFKSIVLLLIFDHKFIF